MPTSAPTIDWQKAPAAFVENVGQSPKDTRFVSLSLGYTLEIGVNGARLVAPSRDSFTLRFGGTQSKVSPVAEKPVAAKFNYYQGKQSRTNLATFAQVRQPGIYPGIDALYYGSQSSLEYDLVVHPGADAGQIQIELERPAEARQNIDGSITIALAHGEWTHRAPVAYQVVAGRRTLVKAHAKLERGAIVFELDAYDHGKELIIDPVLEQVSDLQGMGSILATEMAVGPGGNFAVAASMQRTFNFWELNYLEDVDIRVAKFTANGGMIFFSQITGEGKDSVGGLAIDTSGAVYMAGGTTSTDLPTAGNAFQQRRSIPFCIPFLGDCWAVNVDAFAGKFSGTGQLQWITYLGSSRYDNAVSVALNASNQLHIAGWTDGFLFPVKNEFQACRDGAIDTGSAFLSVLNSTGTALVYSSCLRPNLQTGTFKGSQGMGLTVDSTGKAYLTGHVVDGPGTSSFPVRGANGSNPFQANSRGYEEGFVAKFDPTRIGDASLIYSTLLGGSSFDQGYDVVVDSQGQACVSGHTFSVDFPLRAPAGSLTPLNSLRGDKSDWFVSCLNANGSDLLFSNLYGGTGKDEIPRLVQDAAGNLWVTGISVSDDFPQTNPLEGASSGNGMLIQLAANTREVKMWSRSPLFSEIAIANGLVLLSGSTVETLVECARELNSVQVTQGPIVFDAVSGRFKQTLNLAHSGPLLFTAPGTRLIFSGLATGVQVLSASGTTNCFEPGTPFLTLPLLPSIAQGGVNVTVEFVPGRRIAPIVYTPKITTAGVLP